MNLRLLLLFCFLPLAVFSQAKEEFRLLDVADAVYEDSSNVIQSPEGLHSSLLVTGDVKAVKKDESAYWFHFRVDDNRKKWVIEGYSFRTDEFSLFYKEDGKWKQKKLSWLDSFNKRDYDILNLVIDLPVVGNQPAEYYLKLYSPDGVSFAVFLKSQTAFTNYAIKENTSLGFFYGILLIIAIYNFILFVYLKERNHLFLTLYILASILYSFRSDSFGFKYLWPNMPELNVWMDYFWSPILFITCYSVYAIDFINIKKQYPKLFLGLLGVVVFAVVFMVIEFFLPFNLQLISDIYVIPFVCVFSASVYSYFKGNTFNRFFIIGNALVLVSLIIAVLTNLQIIRGNILSIYGFDFAICLEIIILSLALADRILFLKKQKDAARERLILQLEQNQALQTKVNRELEEKVEQRTLELSTKAEELSLANKELKLVTGKLNQINSKLDYDNWKLNKNVEKETLARLKGTQVSFDEFKRVFIDDLFCSRYLRDLKWDKAFACVKCGHTNYKEIDKHYSRKCSKCGHIESVTSNTLLHRIRFSSLKAFYISYVVFYNLKYTNEELAQVLELSENTCSRYRKKIKDLKSENAISWEQFLLLGS